MSSAAESPDDAALHLEYNELSTRSEVEGESRIPSVVFDKNEELFWTGNEGGYVTSYYGPALQKYTCFRAHCNEAVRSLITTDAGVYTLTKTALKHHIRRGLPIFSFQSENMMNMQCLIAMAENRIIMGGHQDVLIDLDVNTRQERIQYVLDEENVQSAVLKRHSNFLISGDPVGQIVLRDPVSLEPEHTIDLKSSTLSDLDVQDNFVVACGTNKEINVHDVRTLRAMPSIAVSFEPIKLRFLPHISNKLAILSCDGKVEIVDPTISEEKSLTVFQVNTRSSKCTSFDICATGQAFGFADDSGGVHLFSANQNKNPQFNNSSRDTEFPDKPEDLPFVSYNDKTFRPSSIRMPAVQPGNVLSSDWPAMFRPHFARYLDSRNSDTTSQASSQDDVDSVVSH